MPAYLPPDLSPHCQCQGNPQKAFFCMTGHALECHYPMTCRTAGCDHLPIYDFTPEEVHEAGLEADRVLARAADPECATCDGSGQRDFTLTLGQIYGEGPSVVHIGASPDLPVQVAGPCHCIDITKLPAG